MPDSSDKKALRERIRKALASASVEDRKRLSIDIAKKLFSLDAYKKAKAPLFYVALPEEVDTLPMIDEALLAGKRVFVPLADLENKALRLYEIKNRHEYLRKGVLGILEPIPEKARLATSQEIDCVIVPGLVFDTHNNRLGRGKGLYDRFLATLDARIPKIGLAFSFQVVPQLPTESHDIRLDKVITD